MVRRSRAKRGVGGVELGDGRIPWERDRSETRVYKDDEQEDE